MKRDLRDTLVLGAGLAGLSAAYHAGPHTPVFEASDRVGGECVTDHVSGYDFDRSGHLLHLSRPEVKAWLEDLLPQRFNLIARDARIHLLGREVRYPFQANTFGLPSEVKARCLMDYLTAVTAPKRKPAHFLEWARQSFGSEISKLFFEPYNHKLWTVPPQTLTLDWMGPYVPKPDLPAVMKGAFSDCPDGGGYNAHFHYPKHGGIEILPQALAKQLHRVYLLSPAIKLNCSKREVFIRGTGTLPWKQLISSMPLPALAARLDPLPVKIAAAVKRLNASSVLVVNLGVPRPNLHPAHWLYFPEKEFCFYRVGFPSNLGRMAPEGCSSLYAEVALPAGTGWQERKAHARRVRADLVRAGILKPEDRPEVEHVQYLPYAYVIFDKDHAAARKLVLDYFEKHGVFCIGRWGHWEYSAMEDALWAGRQVVEALQG